MSVARFVYSVPALPNEIAPKKPVIPAILRRAIELKRIRHLRQEDDDDDEAYRKVTDNVDIDDAASTNTGIAVQKGDGLASEKSTSNAQPEDDNSSNTPKSETADSIATKANGTDASSSTAAVKVEGQSPSPMVKRSTPEVLDEDAILTKLEELRTQKRKIFEDIAARTVRAAQAKSNTNTSDKRNLSDSSGGNAVTIGAGGSGNHGSSGSNGNVVPILAIPQPYDQAGPISSQVEVVRPLNLPVGPLDALPIQYATESINFNMPQNQQQQRSIPPRGQWDRSSNVPIPTTSMITNNNAVKRPRSPPPPASQPSDGGYRFYNASYTQRQPALQQQPPSEGMSYQEYAQQIHQPPRPPKILRPIDSIGGNDAFRSPTRSYGAPNQNALEWAPTPDRFSNQEGNNGSNYNTSWGQNPTAASPRNDIMKGPLQASLAPAGSRIPIGSPPHNSMPPRYNTASGPMNTRGGYRPQHFPRH